VLIGIAPGRRGGRFVWIARTDRLAQAAGLTARLGELPGWEARGAALLVLVLRFSAAPKGPKQERSDPQGNALGI